MKLTVIGSADASNTGGRGHSCYWLDGMTPKGLLVDCGATALMSVKMASRRIAELDTIVITHLHGDHFGGLPFVLIEALYIAVRTEPLRIVGPAGLEARTNDLLRVVYGDILPESWPFELSWHELAPGESLEVDGATIRAFAADHMDPPEAPLCLRISAHGKNVAFSGDTELCEGLREAARGADLVVGDCTGVEPYVGRHMTWTGWKPILTELKAKKILLSHLGVGVREAIPDMLASVPDGVDVQFADDRLELEL